jgi:hypothetical protein
LEIHCRLSEGEKHFCPFWGRGEVT